MAMNAGLSLVCQKKTGWNIVAALEAFKGPYGCQVCAKDKMKHLQRLLT